MSGDLVRHYLTLEDWDEDISKFGIDIWMTTSALTGGFAVCQARLGSKVHDPKDPGSDLGPMFRQVVGTILRLAVRNADRWLPIHGSHDVPAYGFERLADPPPLEVNTIRLLTEFHGGSLAMAATWAEMLTPSTLATVMELAAEAGKLAEAADRAGEADAGPAMSTERMADALAAFHFPDDAGPGSSTTSSSTAARAPRRRSSGTSPPSCRSTSGGSAASSSRTARSTTDEAEERVERQAREFELLKPYLVERWSRAARPTGPAG